MGKPPLPATPHSKTSISQPHPVDLGGSLAVASRGLFATGVSTDLNVTYLSSGGKIGDLIKAEVTCDKCKSITLACLAFLKIPGR